MACRAGLARRQGRAARRVLAAPGHHGIALRPDGLRGLEGVLAPERSTGPVPARRPCPPVRPVGAPDGDAHAARGGLPRGAGGTAAGRWQLGAARPGTQLLFAAVHDRGGDAPGQPPRRGVPVRSDRQPGAARVRGAEAHAVVGRHRVHPCGAGRYRCGQVWRQLRRLLHRPATGRGQRLRPGRVAGRAGAPVHRGSGRFQPVLRGVDHRRPPPPHASAEWNPAGGRHPGLDPAVGGIARLPGRRGAAHARRVGAGLPRRAHHRDVRVWHRPGHCPGRARGLRAAGMAGGRRHCGSGHVAAAGGIARHPVRPGSGRIRLDAARRHRSGRHE